MNITIFTVTYNEELLIQLMIDHYRSRFPNCHIVIYDNQSTDKTVEIAKSNGCEIRHYDSGGQVNDQMLWNTKNTCWRTATTDWVLVCDLDELLDINEEQLKYEESIGTTKIKCECWHMVNMQDNLEVRNINFGCRNPKDTVYDKDLLFNKKYVEINYINNDCHFTNSRGTIKNSRPYKMWHYKYVNPDIFVEKQKTSAQRLSEINKKNGWGAQCTRDELSLRNEFQQARDTATQVFELKDTTSYIKKSIKMNIAPTGFWESKEQLYHVCDAGLSNWIINLLQTYKDHQIYDFGCGLGQYLKPLEDAGFTKLRGFEGSMPVQKLFNNITQQDLTIPFVLSEKGNVICLEVAEHIPAKYENIFIKNITSACDNYLIMSWALKEPYQDGQGHVNCQNPEQVIPKIENCGFIFLAEETATARKSVSQYNWFENTTMVFRKI